MDNLENKAGLVQRQDDSRGIVDINHLWGIFKIINRLGLHGRPAAKFVKIASKYDCDVAIKKVGESREVSGKSILGLMTLELAYGSEMQVQVSGNDDSGKCLEDLKYLVASGFL